MRKCSQLILVLALVLACLAVAPQAVAINPAATRADEASAPRVLVRRVYVPAADTSSWPTEGQAYLPIEAERLESLLESANPVAVPPPESLATHLYASLDEQANLAGQGAVHLQPLAAERSWLAWPASGLQLANPRWRGQSSAVRLGYWGRDLGVALEVPAAGWLDFDWRMRPQAESPTERAYHVPIPRSLSASLLLDLPAGLRPEAPAESNLLVLAPDEWQTKGVSPPTFDNELPPAAPMRKRWLLRSGSGAALTWRLRPDSPARAPLDDSATYCERHEYRLLESGIQLAAEIDIAAEANLPTTLNVNAPASLVIRSIEWNGQPVRPEIRPDEPGFEIQLPPNAPAAEGTHRLKVDAWYPLADQLVTLPTIELPELFWLTGSVDLQVAPALQLVDLQLRNVVQDMTELAEPDERGDSLRFAKVAPGGRVDLAVARRAANSLVQVGRVIDFSTVDTKGTVYTHFVEPGGQAVRVLSARLGSRWRPRTVTTDAPYEVDEWYETGIGKLRRLIVRVSLNQPGIRSEAPPLRVTVAADSAASESWLPASVCDVLDWEHASVIESLVAFRVADGSQLEWNPEPTPLAEDTVMPHLGTLLPATISSDVYDRRELADGSQLYLKPASPEFNVSVATTVADETDRWSIQHRLQCTTLRGSIEQLQIRSPSMGLQRWRWRIEGDDQWRPLALETLEAGANDGQPTVARGTMTLPDRQAGSFAVLLKADDVPSADCICAPLEVVGAKTLQQELDVRSAEARRIQVRAAGWQLTQSESKATLPLHSCWVPDLEASDQRLSVSRLTVGTAPPLAQVDAASLESVFVAGPTSQHRFRFTIENRAESKVTCTLPAAAHSQRWRRVGDPGAIRRTVDSSPFEIPLRHDGVAEQFEIEFSLDAPAIGHGNVVVAPWPTLSLPVSNGAWSVQYPRDYRVEVQGQTPPERSWRQRLFGFLAGPPDFMRAPATSTTLAQTQVEFEGVEPLAAAIEFRNVSVSQTRRCLLLIAAMLVGYLAWNARTRLIVLLTTAAVAALLLPVPACTWATAAWGGLVLAVVVRTLERATRSLQQWTRPSNPSAFAAPSAGVLLLATLVVALPAAAGDAPPATVESLLIPTDSEGRVASNERYITPRLLAELLRRAGQQTARGAWVISSPRYTGRLSDASDASTSSSSTTWQMAFDLEVLGGNARVELPLGQQGVVWSDAALVDGSPTPLVWNDDGRAVSFRAPRPGRYRVRLGFSPNIQNLDGQRVLSLAIPPLPGAELSLLRGDAADAVVVNGRANGDFLEEVMVVPLSGDPELTVAWRSPDRSGPTKVGSAVLWQWLEITPNQATIEAAFRLASAGPVAPELELLQGNRPVAVDRAERQAASLGWRLVEPVRIQAKSSGEYVARYRLQCDRPAAFGRIRLPQLQLKNFTTTTRHLALAYAENVIVQLSGVVSSEAEVTAADFADHWPDREPPSLWTTLDPKIQVAAVVVRPADVAQIPNESLDVCCLDERLELVYRGGFPASNRPTFFQQLKVSPQLEVSTIEVMINGEPQAVDFGRPAPDRLLVFLAKPNLAPLELVVRGWVKTDSVRLAATGITATVPRITRSNESTAPQQVSLYAADHLAAKVLEADIVPQLVESRVEPIDTWRAYGISTFLISTAGDRPAKIRIQSNRPRFDADLLTTLVRQEGTWIAELGIVIDVREGTLPEVVLDWPTNLTGEVEVDSPVLLSLESTGDPTVRRMHVRFPQAIAANQNARVVLRSAVRAEAATEVSCPRVLVEGAERMDRYVGLIETGGGAWSYRGAKPATGPAEIEGLLAAWPDATLVKATAAQTDVRWVAAPTAESSYVLPLANIKVRQAANGATTLRSQFVIPALNVSRCDILVPAGQQLVQVVVDGQPAVATPLGSTLRLELPDGALPHMVELLTHRKEDKAPQRAEPPQLSFAGQPSVIEYGIWDIQQAASSGRVTSNNAEALPALEVAALRLNQLLAAATSQGLAPGPAPRSWATIWTAQLTAAEQALRKALADEAARSSEIVESMPEQAEYDDLLARAMAQIIRKRAAIDQVPAAESNDPQLWAFDRTADVLVQSVAGPLEWTTLPREGTGAVVRWLLALALGASGVAAVATRDRFRSFGWHHSFLFPLVVVAGLLWWLCLWPRFVGLLLALAAMTAWVRWNRITRDPTPSATQTQA